MIASDGAEQVENTRDHAGMIRAEDREHPDRQPEQNDADDDFEMGRGRSGHRLSAIAAQQMIRLAEEKRILCARPPSKQTSHRQGRNERKKKESNHESRFTVLPNRQSCPGLDQGSPQT